VKRRDFITLLGSAAAALPLKARAQQAERMRRIGVLMNLTPGDPEAQTRIAAFMQGLQELGWAIGRNLRVDYLWGGDADRYRRGAEELVALTPNLILASTNTALEAARLVTHTVPFVGIAGSLACPVSHAAEFSRRVNPWETTGRFPMVSASLPSM
jgi:putative ABC transport system substrate-binding protein